MTDNLGLCECADRHCPARTGPADCRAPLFYFPAAGAGGALALATADSRGHAEWECELTGAWAQITISGSRRTWTVIGRTCGGYTYRARCVPAIGRYDIEVWTDEVGPYRGLDLGSRTFVRLVYDWAMRHRFQPGPNVRATTDARRRELDAAD